MEFLKESVDYFVFGILGLMGFITVWLTAERLIFCVLLILKSTTRKMRTIRRSPIISRRYTSFTPMLLMWDCWERYSAS